MEMFIGFAHMIMAHTVRVGHGGCPHVFTFLISAFVFNLGAQT